VPHGPDGWNLTGGDIIEILSAVPEVEQDATETGYYTVTYLSGMDDRARPDLSPIRRWVTAAAPVHPGACRLTNRAGLWEARTVSAEGQSVSYEPAPSSAAMSTAGVPALLTLDYWRSVEGLAHLRGSVRW
jgi:hypothetical protein